MIIIYTTNITNGNITVNFRDGKVKLPKLKEIKAKVHREFEGQIKSATVSQVPSGKYYVSILVEAEYEELPHTKQKTGLDLGIKDMCITSSGEKYENPKIIKKHERKLAKLQRQLAHKEKRSSNYHKKRKQIALCRNTRKDYLHKVSHEIISEKSDLLEVHTLLEEDGQASDSSNTAQNVTRSWLQKGDKGQKVREMQVMLIGTGYSCGADGADGDFGKNTRNALLNFQHDNELKEDGLYGAVSKAKLESIYAARAAMEQKPYQVGNTYTLQVELKVREGAGTTYRAKNHSELTEDGRKQDADGDGALEKGTRVTCKEVKEIGEDIWIRIPSGWIAAV